MIGPTLAPDFDLGLRPLWLQLYNFIRAATMIRFVPVAENPERKNAGAFEHRIMIVKLFAGVRSCFPIGL